MAQEFVAEFASLESPVRLAIGPDGDVYVAQMSEPLRLSRFRADGQFVTSIQLGSGPEIPYLAFGPDGNLYNDDIVSLGDVVPPGALDLVSVDAFEGAIARRRDWLAAQSSALLARVNDDAPGRRPGGYGEGRLNDDERVSNATTRIGFRCFD